MKKLLPVLLLFILISCGRELESVTVDSDPLKSVSPDTLQESQAEDEDFIHITIGESNPIESLDPLFAESNSEFRLINLIYDGLTRLDDSGNPEPALAKSWQVNRDSTEFTFNLRTDVRFHNVDVFSGGMGKKFNAEEISFIFERMATNQVPDYAANMFSEIRGFNSYHMEQDLVKNAEKRVLNTIEGINVENDSTVTITLKQPSADFLQKLAHPYASVYARESVNDVTPPLQRPAGTGPFYFVTTEDNRRIFAVNREYFGEIADINRLDIISSESANNLFHMFAENELDVLIDLTPSAIDSLIDEEGNLIENYRGNFTLQRADINTKHSVYYNEESGQEGAASQFLNVLDTTEVFENSSFRNLQVLGLDTTSNREGSNEQLSFTHANIPAEVYLIEKLAEHATSQQFTLSISPSYAITEDVTFSTRTFRNTRKILEWETPLYILMQHNISNIEIGVEPWNLNVSDVTVSEEN